MTTVVHRWRCSHGVAARVLRASWYLRVLRGRWSGEPPYILMGVPRSRCRVCWWEGEE